MNSSPFARRERAMEWKRSNTMVSRLPALADDFVSLRDAMDRFFSDNIASSPFRGLWSASGPSGRMPLALDVYGTKDEVVLIAAVPGVRPEDIEITVNQNTITLSGVVPNAAQSEEAAGATWYLHELSHGSFQRSITLPMEVDSTRADATFEQGILRLRVPKAEAAKPKRIEIRSGEPASPAVDAESK
jgi:HSP20 family protein